MTNKQAYILCATVVLLALIGTVWNINSKIIEKERIISTTELETKAAVEQTEERSQFWQKIIPWGEDEEE